MQDASLADLFQKNCDATRSPERWSESPEAMPESALAKLVNGVSCRRYEQVVDMARKGFGVKKSSISRGFVWASSKQVKALAERRLEERFAVISMEQGRLLLARQGGSDFDPPHWISSYTATALENSLRCETPAKTGDGSTPG